MLMSKPLLIGAIILVCILSVTLVLNCSGSRTRRSSDDQPIGGRGGIGGPDSIRDGEVAPQGGALTEVGYGEPGAPGVTNLPGGSYESAPGQSDVPGKASGKNKDLQENSDTFFSKLSRNRFEKFEPTEEMITKTIVGFYRIDGAVYIPEESSGSKSEQVEMYDLWFKMPEGADYKEIVEAYASQLESVISSQQMKTDKGAAAYFVSQVPKKWTKVVIIFHSNDEPNIKIRVKFDKLSK